MRRRRRRRKEEKGNRRERGGEKGLFVISFICVPCFSYV